MKYFNRHNIFLVLAGLLGFNYQIEGAAKKLLETSNEYAQFHYAYFHPQESDEDASSTTEEKKEADITPLLSDSVKKRTLAIYLEDPTKIPGHIKFYTEKDFIRALQKKLESVTLKEKEAFIKNFLKPTCPKAYTLLFPDSE